MQKERAPLYEALKETARTSHARFHVPGHKSGERLDSYTQEHFRSLMEIDMTEIAGLDDLHHAEGVIQEAQQLAADCFGAEESFFLVGGSTAGNLAMILTACDRGDLILMQRNVHKSAIHACMLAGCQVVFLSPRWDKKTQLASGLTPEAVRTALRQYPQARAVFLTNPNYYGMGGDIRGIAAEVHAYGIPLLVDEAHGAHYGFHPEVPASAMACGADAAVQSTHKMLTSLTMGAMLHVQGNRLDRDLLKQRLTMVQSSSPSYPIMASLDLSRRLMHMQGQALIEEALTGIGIFHDRLKAQGLPFAPLPDAPAAAYETLDPFKLVLSAHPESSLSGYELQSLLAERGCVAEMADPRHVVLALSPLTTDDELKRVLAALLDISAGSLFDLVLERENDLGPLEGMNIVGAESLISEPITIHMLSGKARMQDAERVKLEEAAGRLSAEMIIPYPPGIPILYPDERITEQMTVYLERLAKLGAHVQGASDPTLGTLLVR